ncbi:hypothetical protein D3C73_797440 [compost metagenome]
MFNDYRHFLHVDYFTLQSKLVRCLNCSLIAIPEDSRHALNQNKVRPFTRTIFKSERLNDRYRIIASFGCEVKLKGLSPVHFSISFDTGEDRINKYRFRLLRRMFKILFCDEYSLVFLSVVTDRYCITNLNRIQIRDNLFDLNLFPSTFILELNNKPDLRLFIHIETRFLHINNPGLNMLASSQFFHP